MPPRRSRSACFFAALLAALAAWQSLALAQPARQSAGGAPFTLGDGDRVVLLGGTLIEREQSHGYLESALASRFRGLSIQFRNLGWSGDNVQGEARAGFGKVEHGFAELKKQVAEIAPTVILLNYGANESFAGEAGLAAFLVQLDVLLAALDETRARIVFLGPPPHEDLGRPLPDPAEHNRNLKLYSDAIAKVAAKRGAPFVNLFDTVSKLQPSPGGPLTDNGIHLTAYGYWRVAPALEQALGLPERGWQIEIDTARSNIAARGTMIHGAKFSPSEIRFVAHDRQLPLAPAPPDAPRESQAVAPRVVRAFDLPTGSYALKIDGQQVAVGNQRLWLDGIAIAGGPERAQAEQLRAAILDKNLLYFHRWRPQNVTYLFGFRKHEQGNNAVEIPQFDPLVAEGEQAIRALCVPLEHEYQLVKVGP